MARNRSSKGITQVHKIQNFDSYRNLKTMFRQVSKHKKKFERGTRMMISRIQNMEKLKKDMTPYQRKKFNQQISKKILNLTTKKELRFNELTGSLKAYDVFKIEKDASGKMTFSFLKRVRNENTPKLGRKILNYDEFKKSMKRLPDEAINHILNYSDEFLSGQYGRGYEYVMKVMNIHPDITVKSLEKGISGMKRGL